MAAKALDAYEIADPSFKLIRIAGNTVFRVYSKFKTNGLVADGPYENGQYVLRIQGPGNQAEDGLELEMRWLAAICEDTDLRVPKPVRNLNDKFVTECMIPGIAGQRDCTLLHWLKGRRVLTNIRPHHFRAQGEAMAKLHNHAASWKLPKNLKKRRYNFDGLFNDNVGARLPNSAIWPLLPKELSPPYYTVAEKTKKVMDDWGEGPYVYGLIHADCGVDANVLFRKHKAHIIDFDDSGFGYYLYDLAVALEHCWEDKDYYRYKDALLQGYTDIRPLDDEQLIHMDLFLAAFYIYMGLWTIAMDQSHPNSPNKSARHEKWLKYGLRFIKKYINES